MLRLRQAAAIFLLACAALALWHARHWPLVNDAALMQYVVLLMQGGMAPYREIGDINFPGAYTVPWLTALLPCSLPVAARLMDTLACLLAAGAMAAIAGRERRFAAIWAGALFTLYHLRDGIGQSNQRDLWMAMLLLWSVAALVSAAQRTGKPGRLWRVVCFGVLVGSGTAIKPFAAAWLGLLLWLPHPRGRQLPGAFAGFALPLLAAAFFLQYRHVSLAFWRVLRIDLPYHAHLADGTPAQLLLASSAPSILELLGLTLACLVLSRLRPSEGEGIKRGLLALSAALGLLSFVLQGKGYSYQRYPFIAFLLLFAGLTFSRAEQSRPGSLRAFGMFGFLFGAFFCAPAWLRTASRSHWPVEATQAMESAIHAQGAHDGDVQCIDAVSGCTDALLALGLRQATGTLYDEYLFPQTPAPWGTVYPGFPPGAALPRAVVLARERLRPALQAHPPRVLIVSSWLFLEGPGDYGKLALWPWFQQYLAARYTLQSEHSFARAENGPLGFRVYIRQ